MILKKKSFYLGLIVSFMLAGMSLSYGAKHVPGELLVKFKDSNSIGILSQRGVRGAKPPEKKIVIISVYFEKTVEKVYTVKLKKPSALFLRS